MKNLLVSCLALLLSTAAIAADNKDCSYNCFNTTITSMETTEDGCYNYRLSVSYSADCTFALSHLTVETSCGTVTSLTNSENWAQEIGITDPTTGSSGFKIDDIKEFGKSGPESFTVDVTICPDNTSCASSLSCWAPVVAYKAGQCVAYDSISNQCSKLKASLATADPTCADSNDGSIAIEIADGQAPFSYSWSTGDTTKEIRGIPDGNYSVTIFDAHGDTINLSAELIAPSPLSFTYEISNASCDGIDNGAIIVNATGGVGPYTYSWSDGSTESSISNLAPGQYEVTATDKSGCSLSQIFLVESVNQINIQAQIIKAGCTENSGAIDIMVNEGTGNYIFQWLDGPTTEDREQLSAGFYSVTVTDENGCRSSRTFSVKTDNMLTINGSIIPTGCPDDNTGGVDVSVSGATDNVSYLWSTGDTTPDLTGVGAGRYELKVTDEAGCSLSKNFYVFGESITIESFIQHPSCYEATDGSIILTSDEEVTVNWSNGATTAEISGLSEGLYTATVSNTEGCATTLSYYIDAPDPISFTYSIENETCENTSYTASVVLEGGIAPYDIVWEDGSTGAVRENLSAGIYNVSITDKNGCQTSGDITVDSLECTDNPDTGDDPTDEESTEDTTNEDAELGDDSDSSDGSEEDPDGSEDPVNDDDSSQTDGESDSNTDDNDSGEENPDDQEENDDIDKDNSSNPTAGETSCSNPYNVEFTLSETGDCLRYSANITYSGEKSFGLSHAVISTSCGDINDIYTDNGSFESGQDPTTGIDGVKIDEIKGFDEGNGEEQLSFEFNLCNMNCEYSGAVTFVVAYKYGQCIDYDTVTVEIPQGKVSATAYPNPASGKLNFDYKIPDNESVQVELYNKYGQKVINKSFKAGEQLQLDIYNLPNDMYTYRIISQRDVANGKIMVSNN